MQRSHTFVLTNDASETLIVEGVKTSCGCIEAKVDQEEVPPGSHLRLSIDMSLSKVGPATASAWIVFENADPVECTLRADVVVLSRLVLPVERLVVSPGEPASFHLVAIADTPAPLQVATTDGWSGAASGWRHVVADVWLTDIEVAHTGATHAPRRGQLLLKVPGFSPERLSMRLRPLPQSTPLRGQDDRRQVGAPEAARVM
jgi:hypothetical protein